MKIKTPDAFALASVHLIKTASGATVQKVRLISPDAIDWRTYRPALPHDEAVQKALASAGIAHAWCQAALPMDWTPPGAPPSHNEDEDR